MLKSFKLKFFFALGIFLGLGTISILPKLDEQFHVDAVCGQVTFQDSNRTALNSNPVIYKDMHVQIQSCVGNGLDNTYLKITSPNDPAINIEVPMQGGSTQNSANTFQIQLPQGFTIRYELIGRAGGNIIHVGETSMERNPALSLADSPGGVTDTGPGTFSGGCCSNDSQCRDSFGQASSCTGAYTGECQSGRLCSGGSRIAEGQACTAGNDTGVCQNNLNCRQTKTGRFCLKPCNTLPTPAEQWNCMQARYDFDLASAQCKEVDPGCECNQTTFIGAYEDGLPGDNSQSACAIQSSDSLVAGMLFFAGARPTCDVDEVRCDGVVPNVIDANSAASASVQVGCMPPGEYSLRVGRTDGVGLITREYINQSFAVSSSDLAVNVQLGVLPFEQGQTAFIVENDVGDELCRRNVSNIVGSGAVTPDPDKPDPSKDFGSRNCPYSVSCDPAVLNANYPEAQFPGLVDALLAICEGDTARGIYKYNSSDPKPATDQYNEFLMCSRCIRGVDADGESIGAGTWTEAFGCIITTPEGIFTALIRISLGVMGGIALIRVTYLGIITAQSKDEGKIAEARKGVIATLSGVAIVILAVLILRVIGVNILDIVPPGFF